MKKYICVLLCALSGILLPLALPNETAIMGSPIIGLYCLVPVFIALCLCPSPAFGLLLGAIFGGLTQFLGSYWLMFFKDFSIWTIGGSTFGYIVLYSYLFGFLAWLLPRCGKYRAFIFALGYIAFEYYKSIGFLGYPYGLIAYSWNEVLPFNQIADVTSIYGPGIILVLTNAILGDGFMRFFGLEPIPTIKKRFRAKPLAAPKGYTWARLSKAAGAWKSALGQKQLWFFVASLWLISLAYGLYRCLEPMEKSGSFDAVLVQQNGDSWMQDFEPLLQLSQDLTRDAIAREGKTPDIVFWSETCLLHPYDEEWGSWYDFHPNNDPFTSFVRSTGTYLFTGVPHVYDYQEGLMSNSVILIDPNAKLVDFYSKQHLVPFAEGFPFLSVPFVRDFMRNVVGLYGSYVQGDRALVFEFPTKSGRIVKFGAPICFEDCYSDVCAQFVREGAELLVNLTNDSWSQTVSSETQHLVVARYRTIENRVTLLRSTNAGVSCVIDPKGQIQFQMPLFKALSDYAQVTLYEGAGNTIYNKVGDAFAIIISGLFLFVFFWKYFAWIRERSILLPRA